MIENQELKIGIKKGIKSHVSVTLCDRCVVQCDHCFKLILFAVFVCHCLSFCFVAYSQQALCMSVLHRTERYLLCGGISMFWGEKKPHGVELFSWKRC